MIYKTLDQLADELAETIERISELTDLGKFYEDQQNILAGKNWKLHEVKEMSNQKSY